VRIKPKLVAAFAAAAVIAGGVAFSTLGAGASVSGAEYTNAGINPVAGYLVQATNPTKNVTQISSYIGSNNSHSLAQLPVGTKNGFGIEVCNSDGTHNRAIQVGVVHSGANLMDVDWAVGDLGQPVNTSNANACQNGVLGNFGATVHQLLTGVPINDTVNVQLTYDNGSARDRRGDRHHIGQWLVTAQVVPNGEYTTYAGGLTPQTAWVTPGVGHFNMAGFGTEANFAQALTPLSASSAYLGSEAHMRLEYNSDGTNDYTFMNVPSSFTQTLEVDSTSNGDSPGDGGVTYIKPSAPSHDAFNVFEGGLVS
jgi:hypothetical protein